MHTPAAGSVRLLHITDTHLLADPEGLQGGVNVEERFQRVLAAMRPWAEGADGLIHTGDMVHDETPAGYTRLQAGLETLGLPGLVMPGNHDDPSLIERFFSDRALGARRVMAFGPWSVIALNTQRPGEVAGHLSEAELEALGAALGGSDAAHVLLAMHHPPLAVGTAWLDAIGLDNPPALQSAVDADNRVAGVVFGHVHMAFDGHWQGLRALATPATAVEFVAGAEQFARGDAPPGFRWIDLAPDGTMTTGVVQVPLD